MSLKPRRLRIYRFLTNTCPLFRNAFRFRCAFLRWAGAVVGPGCRISPDVLIQGKGTLEIGANCVLFGGVKLYAEGILRLGDGLNIRAGTTLVAKGTLEIGGEGKTVSEEVLIQSYQQSVIKIGIGGCVAPRTYISATGNSRITIGDHCKIAHMVSIKTNEHVIDPAGPCIGGERRVKDITVKDGCWVCAGSILIPGVTVGRKCVVAAGAVVTRDTPDLTLVAGCPAVVKKHYAE